MNELVSNAQWAVERLECEDWEVGPFDGHCLRLTCKRCRLDQAVKELATCQAELAAMRERAEAAEHLAKRMAGLLKTTMPQLHAMKSHNTGAPMTVADCTWGLCHLHRELIGKAEALAAAPPAPAADQDDDRVECPNGCYGRLGDGCHGEPVPRYCGRNGCDVESPGMAYRPAPETDHHEYVGACRNVQHADSKCTCNHLVNGRRCGLSRRDPIHIAPAADSRVPFSTAGAPGNCTDPLCDC